MYGRNIPDPKKMPVLPTATGKQSYSELYVGTPEECCRIPNGDPRKTGTVTYQSYTDIDGTVQSAGIYLPAGYDRTKEYPLIIASHGGGGNECEWFTLGNLNHMMDNLIAQGRTREAIVVTPNNAVYQWAFDDWDFEKIAENTETCLIPFIEKIYNVSMDVHDRAFCGLSMGGRTTAYILQHRSRLFDYYGAISGGISKASPFFSLEDPHIREVNLMIGCGEEDIAYNLNQIGVKYTIEDLKKAGVPFHPYFVKGSHDWFTFTQMFDYFAENVLWK